jgi:hypothetical protein
MAFESNKVGNVYKPAFAFTRQLLLFSDSIEPDNLLIIVPIKTALIMTIYHITLDPWREYRLYDILRAVILLLILPGIRIELCYHWEEDLLSICNHVLSFMAIHINPLL